MEILTTIYHQIFVYFAQIVTHRQKAILGEIKALDEPEEKSIGTVLMICVKL